MATTSVQPSGAGSGGAPNALGLGGAPSFGLPGPAGAPSVGSSGSPEAPGMTAGPVGMGMMGGNTGAVGAAGAGGAMGAAGAANAGSGGGAGSASMTPPCMGDGDRDGDGTSDCTDGCPDDPNKLEAGSCGCGVLDSDIDFDGTLDCQDQCPANPAKTEPGLCGCASTDDDTDNDGTLDCNDTCPQDATRIAPGTCGCGAANNLQLCLRHRYSFNGGGTVADDSVGNADGDIIGTTLAGNGTLTLAGVASDQYVELPAGIISELGPSATIEAWVTWTGAGAPWQRIFDFGSSEFPPGQQGTGVTYLFLTPSNTINPNLRLAYTNEGPPFERVVNAAAPLPAAAVSVAVVINGPAQSMTLYQNGALIGTVATLDTTLNRMDDVNNWLGRSQFVADEEFQGVLDEVRIYSSARSAAQVAASNAAGPNNLPAQ